MMQLWVLQPASGSAGSAGSAVRGGDRVVTAWSGAGVEQLEPPGSRRMCEDGQKKGSQISSARERRDHQSSLLDRHAKQTNIRVEVMYSIIATNRWSIAFVAVAVAAGA